MLLLRHLLSILLLPFIVVIVIPFWLLTALATMDWRWAEGVFVSGMTRGLAVVIDLSGLALFGWCVSLFARVGQGTLAPWDPTRALVAVGPYRFVRNPMISGVALMLIGQAVWWGSWIIGAWALAFIGINHAYFLLSEEPGLEARFGENYRRYKANVPRWIPRRTPWTG